MDFSEGGILALYPGQPRPPRVPAERLSAWLDLRRGVWRPHPESPSTPECQTDLDRTAFPSVSVSVSLPILALSPFSRPGYVRHRMVLSLAANGSPRLERVLKLLETGREGRDVSGGRAAPAAPVAAAMNGEHSVSATFADEIILDRHWSFSFISSCDGLEGAAP